MVFAFTGVLHTTVDLEPEDFRGLSQEALAAEIVAMLMELEPEVEFDYADAEHAAETICEELGAGE